MVEKQLLQEVGMETFLLALQYSFLLLQISVLQFLIQILILLLAHEKVLPKFLLFHS